MTSQRAGFQRGRRHWIHFLFTLLIKRSIDCSASSSSPLNHLIFFFFFFFLSLTFTAIKRLDLAKDVKVISLCVSADPQAEQGRAAALQ